MPVGQPCAARTDSTSACSCAWVRGRVDYRTAERRVVRDSAVGPGVLRCSGVDVRAADVVEVTDHQVFVAGVVRGVRRGNPCGWLVVRSCRQPEDCVRRARRHDPAVVPRHVRDVVSPCVGRDDQPERRNGEDESQPSTTLARCPIQTHSASFQTPGGGLSRRPGRSGAKRMGSACTPDPLTRVRLCQASRSDRCRLAASRQISPSPCPVGE
jgi:hypothetical protein